MELLKLNKELKKAVFNQNSERVAYLLENGADATYRVNLDAGNLLHHVNDVQIAILLIDKGAKVNARNRYRKTPLHVAVENNNSEIVSLLLKKGASMSDVEVICKKSPLSIAIENNNLMIVKILIEFGCNIHQPMNMFLDNALHLALRNTEINLDMISFLLEKGANVNELDYVKNYPIHIALKNKSCTSAVISKLIRYGADINCKNTVGNTPLHFVVESGNVDLLKAILKYSPCINSFNSDGLNPLHTALRQCVELDIVKLLLSYGCSTNVFDLYYFDGCIPITVVNSLRSGNFVNVCDKYGYRPLDLAVGNIKFHDIDVIKELLQHGASTKNIALFAVKIKEKFYATSTFYTCQLYFLDNNIEPINGDSIIDDVFKLLIKYAVINEDVDEFLGIDLFENSIGVYTNLCQTEMSLLEEELGVSLLELSSVKNTSDMLPHGLLCKMIQVATGNNFPIYKNFIQTQFKRLELIEILLKQNIAVNNISSQKPVNLDWASVSHIAKYLTNLDLLNLIAAFNNSSNIVSKFTINKKNKFSQHLLCNTYNNDIIQLIMSQSYDMSKDCNYFYSKQPFKHIDFRCVSADQKLNIDGVFPKNIILNIVNGCHSSLLLNAIELCESVEFVEYLLKLGANIFAVTKNAYDNALHLALQGIHSRSLSIVRVLLKYGAKADTICNYAEKAKNIPIEIVRSLKSGHFVNIVNVNGTTPMHLVFQHQLNKNISDIVMELLLYGGDLTTMDNSGRNPVSYFAQRVLEIPPTEINQINIAKNIFKLLIKFAVINNNFDNLIFSPLNPVFGDSFMHAFTLDCQQELSLLEKETISDICFGNSDTCKTKNGKCVLSYMMDRIFEICDRREYPIYEDLLVAKIHRSDLLKQLSSLVPMKLSYPKTTNLAISSILPHITEYLNKQDLLNWTIAFAVQSSLTMPFLKGVGLKRSICDPFQMDSYSIPSKTKKL